MKSKNSGEILSSLALFSLFTIVLGSFIGSQTIVRNKVGTLFGKAQTNCTYESVSQIKINGVVARNLSGFEYESRQYPNGNDFLPKRDEFPDNPRRSGDMEVFWRPNPLPSNYIERNAQTELFLPVGSNFRIKSFFCTGRSSINTGFDPCRQVRQLTNSNNPKVIRNIPLLCGVNIEYGWDLEIVTPTVTPTPTRQADLPPLPTTPTPTPLAPTPCFFKSIVSVVDENGKVLTKPEVANPAQWSITNTKGQVSQFGALTGNTTDLVWRNDKIVPPPVPNPNSLITSTFVHLLPSGTNELSNLTLSLGSDYDIIERKINRHCQTEFDTFNGRQIGCRSINNQGQPQGNYIGVVNGGDPRVIPSLSVQCNMNVEAQWKVRRKPSTPTPSCPLKIPGLNCAPTNFDIDEVLSDRVEMSWDYPRNCSSFRSGTDPFWIDVIDTTDNTIVCSKSALDLDTTCQPSKHRERLINKTIREWDTDTRYRVNVYTTRLDFACVSSPVSDTFTYEEEPDPTNPPSNQLCNSTGQLCNDTYTESCTANGRTGTKTCTKYGRCTGVGDGTKCSWEDPRPEDGKRSSCTPCSTQPQSCGPTCMYSEIRNGLTKCFTGTCPIGSTTCTQGSVNDGCTNIQGCSTPRQVTCPGHTPVPGRPINTPTPTTTKYPQECTVVPDEYSGIVKISGATDRITREFITKLHDGTYGIGDLLSQKQIGLGINDFKFIHLDFTPPKRYFHSSISRAIFSSGQKLDIGDTNFYVDGPLCAINVDLANPDLSKCPEPGCPAGITLRDQISQQYGLCPGPIAELKKMNIFILNPDDYGGGGYVDGNTLFLRGSRPNHANHEFIHVWHNRSNGPGFNTTKFAQDAAEYSCKNNIVEVPEAYNLLCLYRIPGQNCPTTTCNLSNDHYKSAIWWEIYASFGQSGQPPAELSKYYNSYYKHLGCSQTLQTFELSQAYAADIPPSVPNLESQSKSSNSGSDFHPPLIDNLITQQDENSKRPNSTNAILIGNVALTESFDSGGNTDTTQYSGVNVKAVNTNGKVFETITDILGHYELALPVETSGSRYTITIKDHNNDIKFFNKTLVIFPAMYYNTDVTVPANFLSYSEKDWDFSTQMYLPIELKKGENKIELPRQFTNNIKLSDVITQLDGYGVKLNTESKQTNSLANFSVNSDRSRFVALKTFPETHIKIVDSDLLKFSDCNSDGTINVLDYAIGIKSYGIDSPSCNPDRINNFDATDISLIFKNLGKSTLN